MERFVVGFTTVTLLFSSVGHGRADYVSANQFASPNSGQFLNPQSVTVDLPWNLLVADGLNNRIRTFLTNFSSLGSGERQFFELTGVAVAPSGNAMAGDSLNARTRQFTSEGTFPTASGGFGIGGFYDPFGVEVALSRDIFVADPLIHPSEMSRGDDLFLAKFGNFGLGGAQFSQPARVALDLSGNGSGANLLLNHKLVLSLILLGLVVLGSLGYAWRQRRAALQRTLRGPRRTALYRSSSFPDPRGTRR